MEISGKVIQVLDMQKGTSAKTGKDWASQSFILETQEQYPRKVAIDIFGEDKIKSNIPSVDDVVTASFDLESRESNGRWYTSARAWKVVKGDGAQTPAAQPMEPATPAAPSAPAKVAPTPTQAPASASGEQTDLPF